MNQDAIALLDKLMLRISRESSNWLLKPVSNKVIQKRANAFAMLNRARCYLNRFNAQGHCVCGEHELPLIPAWSAHV